MPLKSFLFLKTLFSLMSIVLKVIRCAGRYSWMSHQTSIVVYIEFAWNYAGFNLNYYSMRIMQLWKSPNYANKFQNYSTIGDSWIPVWLSNYCYLFDKQSWWSIQYLIAANKIRSFSCAHHCRSINLRFNTQSAAATANGFFPALPMLTVSSIRVYVDMNIYNTGRVGGSWRQH